MKLMRDTWLVFGRYFSIFIHNPAWVAVGVLQPAIYLLLFAPLLKSIAHIPGFPPGGAYNVFVPGLLVQLGIFGASGVGFSLIAELREGVVERLRVTPVSRLSLLLGRAMRDTLTLLVQSLILVLIALPFGLSIQPVGMLVVLALVGLIGLMFASISYWLALVLRDENSFAPVIFTAALPLLLLSGVLLPMTLAPSWLQTISTLNPLSHAVTAARDIFLGNIANGNVGLGFLIMAALALLAVAGAARSFGRAIA
ncbi:MAG: ABC transporter permease [Candidatus Dormibacteraeota bacterium]|nr:ABC transporter permease [Candidatus Dormibacteraeota bacterium]